MNLITHYDDTATSMASNPEVLLKEHLPLIRYHALQLIHRMPNSIEMDDLIDAGVLGLLDGAKRFDASRGIQFKTFIAYRIRGSMIDYLRTFDWFPRSLRDMSGRMAEAILTLSQQYGRPAEEKEIALFLNINLGEYRERLTQMHGISVVYFDDLPKMSGDDEALDMIGAISGGSEQTPEHQAAMIEFTEKLADAIDLLPLREKVLITLYYYEELNMKEVAAVLGVTESRVSQLHSQMVVRLRGSLKLDVPGDP